jgi:predicted O-methyltransferase YrrM
VALKPAARFLRRAASLLERTADRNSIRAKVVKEGLTYLDPKALALLEREVRSLEIKKTAGCILEMGCALGGSAIVICAQKSQRRPLYVYDTFQTIPSPTAKDGKDVHDRYKVIQSGMAQGIGGQVYYGYRSNLKQEVIDRFAVYGYPADQNNVHFVQGLYQDTLDLKEPVALAHIDCDWYDSVWTCLDRIVPHLAHEGVIVVDDYFDYSGCRAAVWDFFRKRLDEFTISYDARVLIRRK